MTATPVVCSFCGTDQHTATCIVAGPSVFICDGCIRLCGDIAEEHRVERMVRRFMAKVETEAAAVRPLPIRHV
jgi:ATP-dependent protease Clp ATPase subunit